MVSAVISEDLFFYVEHCRVQGKSGLSLPFGQAVASMYLPESF